MAFPVIGKQNAPQIGMPVEANPKQIENLAFQPVRARPHRHQRIHHRIAARKPHFQPHFFAPWNGNQVIVQFESRLVRDNDRRRSRRSAGCTAAPFCSRQCSAVARSSSRGTTMVVSPRNSITSATALAFHERSCSATTLAFWLEVSVTISNPASAGYLCQSSAPFFQR